MAEMQPTSFSHTQYVVRNTRTGWYETYDSWWWPLMKADPKKYHDHGEWDPDPVDVIRNDFRAHQKAQLICYEMNIARVPEDFHVRTCV